MYDELLVFFVSRPLTIIEVRCMPNFLLFKNQKYDSFDYSITASLPYPPPTITGDEGGAAKGFKEERG